MFTEEVSHIQFCCCTLLGTNCCVQSRFRVQCNSKRFYEHETLTVVKVNRQWGNLDLKR